MKDENIKEILDKLKDNDWYEELDTTGTKWIELKQEETKILLDYITNLQTIEREYSAILSENAELQDYKTRNEKAIEYVNTHKPSDTISFPLMKKDEENQVKSCFDYEFREIYQKELLEILQEKSDENE